MSKPINPFEKFTIKPETAFIKALDSEVTYRKLTMAESDAFNARLVKEYDAEGMPEFNYDEATAIKYEKCSLVLIDPPMTVDELKGLDGEVIAAIAEINMLASGNDGDESVDEKGNQKD